MNSKFYIAYENLTLVRIYVKKVTHFFTPAQNN